MILKNRAKSTSKPTPENKEYTRPRNVNLAFRVTEEERAMIDKRIAQTGMSNLRAYMVKMAIDGRVVHVELDSVREMVRLLSNLTSNVNQISRRANETGSVYARDLDVLRGYYEEIWGQAKEILQKLYALQNR